MESATGRIREVIESEDIEDSGEKYQIAKNIGRAITAETNAILMFLAILAFQKDGILFYDLIFYFTFTFFILFFLVLVGNLGLYITYGPYFKKNSFIQKLKGKFIQNDVKLGLLENLDRDAPYLNFTRRDLIGFHKLDTYLARRGFHIFDLYCISVFCCLFAFIYFYYADLYTVLYESLLKGAMSFVFLFSIFLNSLLFYNIVKMLILNSKNFWWTRMTRKHRINSTWTSVIQIASITKEGNPFYYTDKMKYRKIHAFKQFEIIYILFMCISIIAFLYYIAYLYFACERPPQGNITLPIIYDVLNSQAPFCSFFTLDQLSPTWFLVVLTCAGLIAAFLELRSRVRAENRVVWVTKVREHLSDLIAITQEEDIRKKDALTYFLDTKSLTDPPFNYQTPIEIKKQQISKRVSLELLLNPNEIDHQLLSFLVRINSSLDVATADDRDVIDGIENESKVIKIMSRRGIDESKVLIEDLRGYLEDIDIEINKRLLDQSKHFFFVLRVFKYYRPGTLIKYKTEFDQVISVSKRETESELLEDWKKIVLELYDDDDSKLANLLNSSSYPIIDDPRFRALVVAIIMRVAHALLKREWERVKNAH